VLWNGSPRPTTFVNRSQLTAPISAADLVSSAAITTATVTVVNPHGIVSDPMLFTITGAGLGGVQSALAAFGQSASVATPNINTPLTSPGQAAVSATLNNADTPGTVTASVATYTSNPTGVGVIDLGGGFVDLKIVGADAGDSVTANFYYPSSISDPIAEPGLRLQFFNGTMWVPVLSSGGLVPLPNTTDNLDGTTSGGRFTVTFDSSSTPLITALSGTVFAVAPPDTTAPTIQVPASMVASTDPGNCSARVNYTATATDDSGSATLVCTPPSGSLFPKGTTTVNCVATDSSGNQATASFTVTVVDTTAPVLGPCPAGGPYILNSGPQTTPQILATDNCAIDAGASTLSCVVDTSSVGTKPVTFKAVDTSGNTAVQPCSYQVIYQPAGVSGTINGTLTPGHQILQPVNATAPYSVFKQGSTVPFKFVVFDANGKSVGTAGVVAGMSLTGELNGTTSDVNEAIVSATPDSAFHWDSANQQWVFNLSTKNLPKNATFYYTITLNDGTAVNFHFGLR
jgi:hypothetical protein